MSRREPKNFRFFFLISLLIIGQLGHAQIRISGLIQDENGLPLIGATVLEEGTTNGAISDLDGKFMIGVSSENSVLDVSYIGYGSQLIPLNGKTYIEIVLKPSDEQLEEVVVIGYGTQKKESVVGAISTTSSKELLKSPVGSVTAALAGRLTGLTTVQTSGAPGGDSPNIYIRGVSTLNGTSPLIIVDGVERSSGSKAGSSSSFLGNISGFEQINPNDIESVSILKDASATAVYGVRGANGVIIITTKKGNKGAPVIKYSGSYGISQPIRLRESLLSEEFGYYANEGGYNDGTGSFMTWEDMNRYKFSYNDILYPSMDINEYVLEDYGPRTSHNLSLRGGGDIVKYFTSVGYYDEQGIIKQNPAYGFDPNNSYNRINMRSNLDFQFTKYLSASVNIDGRFEKRHGAAAPHDASFWWKMYQARPWISPGFADDGTYIETELQTAYPIFRWIQTGGVYDRNQTTFNTVFNLKYDFSKFVKGLSAHVKYSFDNFVTAGTTEKRGLGKYIPIEVEGETYLRLDGYTNPFNYSSSLGKRRKDYAEAALNYARSFGKHNVTALALYSQDKKYYSESQYPDVARAYMGFVGRATYNYDYKYFTEMNMGYNGTEMFPPGQRFGFFPSVSMGWLLSEESFMQNIKDFVSYFKIRGSVGKVGNDRIGNYRFAYIPGNYALYPGLYENTMGEPITGSVSSRGLQEGKAANMNITWETALKYNLGFDSKFFTKKLSLTVDVFKEYRQDILTTMQDIPWMAFPQMGHGNTQGWATGDYKAPVNYAEVENKGFEIETRWNGKIGSEFNYFIGGTYAFSINNATTLSEGSQAYPWLYAQGLPLSTTRGLLAEGYYESFAEIEDINTPYNTYDPHPIPGDIKYKDVNGDMKIDINDRVPLGAGAIPRTTFSGNLGFSYKGFDFSVLLQGATGVTFLPTHESMIMMNGGDNGFSWIEDRWTPYKGDGQYPVLHDLSSLNTGASNFQPSSYWAYDATYVRVKNIEIGYRLPEKFVKKLTLADMRIFFSGQNLYTWTPQYEMQRFDPEMIRSRQVSHPLMLVYNTGITVTF